MTLTNTITELLAQFTHNNPHGQNRLVYNQAWLRNQQRLLDLGHQLGAQTTVDAVGNIYLDFLGRDQTRTIATGSHMDTVVNGGKYDGLYGILGGLCAIRRLITLKGPPPVTLRLIAFSEEEGSRFNAAFTGSTYLMTHQLPDYLIDATGTSFASARKIAIAQLGHHADQQVAYCTRPTTFTELHIEQGPRLKTAGKKIGLVQGIVAQQRLLITAHGVTNHAGTTPMNQRQDAVKLGSHLITSLYQLAAHHNDLILTVGKIKVVPNVTNAIAGTMQFSVDFRTPSNATMTVFNRQLTALLNKLTDVTIESTLKVPSTCLSKPMLTANIDLAQRLSLPYLQLFSGAGHDSQIISSSIPTAMIFVPSNHGYSHCPQEYTAPEDLVTGIKVLIASLHQQAYL
ncbi:Zn-dependent hydrolase [Lactiplantibacillus sp. DA1]|uniref:Zn-dependent hydrolase n=1 Tax=Lactiplantibacillus sp. DA1 TaxID=3079857 RepID=UPI00292A6433|nr:Zn-dependent hydrolase [Lactiplantibacillus sp. DA1]MDV0429771.1 Zn-dependent hydrolase [Lactiplantibacillus sp. DA1]